MCEINLKYLQIDWLIHFNSSENALSPLNDCKFDTRILLKFFEKSRYVHAQNSYLRGKIQILNPQKSLQI